MRFGPWEIGLILVIVLIVFGVGKLPQIGSAMGKTIREFKRAQHDDSESAQPSTKESAPTTKSVS